mgnify:CR=1 FL=1
MMESEQIKKIIAAGLSCEGLHVEGDGQHFEAILVSSEFIGKSRVPVSYTHLTLPTSDLV